MSAPLKFGVIGAGEIGRLRVGAVRKSRSAELGAVADVARERAESAVVGTAARAFADWRELLELEHIDAVIVSSPVHMHEEMAVAALGAGKHVLCEKPLSNTVASCLRILDAAAAAGKTLAVGFNHRYFPCFRFLRRAIDLGLVGTVDHLRLRGGHDGLHNFRADWMYRSPLSGGGAMMDVGIHFTDLAHFLIGEITEVYGVTSNRVWRVEGSEDNALAILKGAGGVPAIYQATWSEWKGFRYSAEVYGDLGMAGAYYGPMINLLITRDRATGRKKRSLRLYPRINLREKFRGWQTTAAAAFAEELEDFGRMIDGERVTLADGLAGLKAVEVANAVYQSSERGVAVKLSP